MVKSFHAEADVQKVIAVVFCWTSNGSCEYVIENRQLSLEIENFRWSFMCFQIVFRVEAVNIFKGKSGHGFNIKREKFDKSDLFFSCFSKMKYLAFISLIFLASLPNSSALLVRNFKMKRINSLIKKNNLQDKNRVQRVRKWNLCRSVLLCDSCKLHS